MHALAEVVQYVRQSLDDGKSVCSLFIDLTKAFDTVNHDILIEKLGCYGLSSSALSVIRDYLKNRMQFVQLGEHNSKLLKVTCGVPQGSVLGPLLFIIYINDISRVISQGKIVTFADDTAAIFNHLQLGELKEMTQLELNKMAAWFAINKLTLNVSKTNFMLFTRRKTETSQNFKLTILGEEVTRVSHARYLGIEIDDQLNWNEHIANVTKKVRMNTSMIYKIGHAIDLRHRKMLYNAFVLPHVSYCLPIWGIGYKTHYSKLTVSLNAAARALVFAKIRGTNMELLYHSLSLLDFERLVFYNVAICMWRIQHKQAPSYLCQLFKPVNQRHSYGTRRATSGLPYTELANLNQTMFTISLAWAKIWEKFNPNIRNMQGCDNFKKACKNFLLQSNTDALRAPRYSHNYSRQNRDFLFF